MKKYLVFLCSFIIAYLVIEIGSGMLLTFLYTPELSVTNVSMNQEVELAISQSSILPFFTILFSATFAYFVSQRLFVNTKK